MSDANEHDQNDQPQDQPADETAGLKSALEKEREARKTAEKAAKDLERRLAAIENSGKSESEKLAARLAELEKANEQKDRAIRERDAKDAVLQAARSAGASGDALNAVYRMVRSDLEYDDSGSVANLDTLIKDAKAIAPQLFRVGRADGGSGNGSKPGGETPNQIINRRIREAAGYA